MTKNSISNGPHELRRQLDHSRQKSLCRRDVASRRRGLLLSLMQLLGVFPLQLFFLEMGQGGQTDEWRSDEVGLLLPSKLVRTCGR